MSADNWDDAAQAWGCAVTVLGWAAAIVAFGLLFRACEWALS